MDTSSTRRLILATFLAALPVTACGIDVTEEASRTKKEVDIRTPVGSLSVDTDIDAPDTGLPVYPGARVRRNDDDHGSANVSVALPFVDVKVVAASYEHEDAQDAILAFYRKAMSTYGDVVECRGEIDFKGRMGTSRPVCDERRTGRIQLVVGTEDRHRVVSVKPGGAGSEFSVVYIQTKSEG